VKKSVKKDPVDELHLIEELQRLRIKEKSNIECLRDASYESDSKESKEIIQPTLEDVSDKENEKEECIDSVVKELRKESSLESGIDMPMESNRDIEVEDILDNQDKTDENVEETNVKEESDCEVESKENVEETVAESTHIYIAQTKMEDESVHEKAINDASSCLFADTHNNPPGLSECDDEIKTDKQENEIIDETGITCINDDLGDKNEETLKKVEEKLGDLVLQDSRETELGMTVPKMQQWTE